MCRHVVQVEAEFSEITFIIILTLSFLIILSFESGGRERSRYCIHRTCKLSSGSLVAIGAENKQIAR